jgi:hypothetical protein
MSKAPTLTGTSKEGWASRNFGRTIAASWLAFAGVLIPATMGLYAALNSIDLTSRPIKSINALGWGPTAVVWAACAAIPFFFFLIVSIVAYRENQEIIDRQIRPADFRILTTKRELYNALYSVVNEAEKYLLVSGSRSRDKGYLSRIRERVFASNPIEFYCILFGPPRNTILHGHLKELLESIPAKKLNESSSNVHIALLPYPGRIPERFVCLNEKKAVIPLQSVNRIDEYDTALVITDLAIVGQLYANFANMIDFPSAKRISVPAEIPDAYVYEPPEAADGK